MSDSKPDDKNSKDTGQKKSTLSLKGVGPKVLNKTQSGASGPVVELRQKRRGNSQGQSNGPRGHKRNPNRSGNGSASNLSARSDGNNMTLSRSEQEARNRALSVARQYQQEEKKIAQQQEAQPSSEVKSDQSQGGETTESPVDLSPVKKDETSEAPAKKRLGGPRVLGQVDLNKFDSSKKKTVRLERRDGPTNNRRHNNNRSSNDGRPGGGQRHNNRNDQNQRPGSAPQRNSTDNNAAQKNNFSNQRASFSSEMIDIGATKTPSRKVAAKPKGRSGFEDNDANSNSKKSLQPSSKERSRKVTITNALDDNFEGPTKSIAAHRRRLNKRNKAAETSDSTKVYREVTIPDTITVQELASRMSERSADVVKELMKLGIMATLNKVLDAETAEIIVETMGHTFVRVSEADVENIMADFQDDEALLLPRAPVVTIMGHVDHGKTSLLDALRKTNVVSGEAGGITQHIGAYQVRLEDGRKVSFIDTPGHAAFSEMRSRGAKVTDVVILVVAADDGVKQQTVEAIKHAKAAEVPMIIAINKMDKQGADPSRVRNELLQHEIIVESLGGDTLEVEVSAKEGTGLDQLIDILLLQAEIMDLKANPNRYAQGVVIEAELNKGRGSVATILVQHGTLNVGDIIVAGAAWGRVRALQNDLGQNVKTVGPSDPVEVLGLGSVPLAGDQFYVMENDAKARELAEYREEKLKEKANLTTARTLDSLMSQIKDSEKQFLPVVIKGDVQGSVEAIAAALAKVGNDEVQVQIVHSAVGGVTESDINLAEASEGVVFGFNVRANKQARDLAETRNIEIRYYSVIYDLINDIKDALSGLLKPELRENFLGNAEILQVFEISKHGKVAGCRVREGMAKRSAKVRLIRDDIVIHEGVLSTLRRFKDEVKEVKDGYECGMAFENYHDIREGDMIEIFEIQEIARQLS